MIISAPFRSGGTIFAKEYAANNNKKFIGQIDLNSVNFIQEVNKNAVHELSNQPELTLFDISQVLDNHEDSVILNNSNPALFSQSDYFLLRRRIKNTYCSHASLLIKLGWEKEVWGAMRRLTYFIGLQLIYMQTHNITPLYYEDLRDVDTEYNLPDYIIENIDKQLMYIKDLNTSFNAVLEF